MNLAHIKPGDKPTMTCQTSRYKQPAQQAGEPDWSWVCNECGSHELTSSVTESDLDYLACTSCGCNEFHKEHKASQPAQQPTPRYEPTNNEGSEP